ncbi:hypothetical protein HYV49_04665 [Candidatus Pacearchaeota archaeon]|nr:hypothetical protein [Candidatus Pacearchaeota archaeon]
MNKRNRITELAKLLVNSLSHKIGSIVNKEDPYAEKYSKEAINFFNLAKKVLENGNWNNYDKIKIKEELKKKLSNELEKRDFLDKRKFDIMDEEIDKALKELDLNLD